MYSRRSLVLQGESERATFMCPLSAKHKRAHASCIMYCKRKEKMDCIWGKPGTSSMNTEMGNEWWKAVGNLSSEQQFKKPEKPGQVK